MVMALETSGVTVRFGDHTVVDHVDVCVAAGEWVAVVGPNGAGKSTLLRAIAGLVKAGGEVTIQGDDLAALDRRTRARSVALVPQSPVVPPGMTLGDYVLLGRTAHLAPLAAESAHDMEVAHWTLAELDLLPLAGRPLDEVSGGERQRAFLARALAQEAPILLLDEPTTALDIGHQQDVLELIDGLRSTRDLAVCTTMHDLTLAGQFADRLVLLEEGSVVVSGPPTDVLTAEHLTRYYGAAVDVIEGPDGPIVVPRRSHTRDFPHALGEQVP